MKKSTILFLLALLGFSQSIAQTDGPLPIVREGVKWVNEKVIVNHGDTTRYYYTYEICGEDSIYPFDEETGPFKACYYYTGENLDVEADSLIAGLRGGQYSTASGRNIPYTQAYEQNNLIIDVSVWMTEYTSERLLYDFSDFTLDDPNGEVSLSHNIVDYFLEMQSYGYHGVPPRDPYLTHESFYEVDPIEVEGVSCRRWVIIGEDGEPLAYFVEGIGFDSYDMGDLLTPFTRRPDPNADYQEWCGLSHVIKDGQIIYKGMRYRPEMPNDEGEYEYVPFVREGVKWTYSICDYHYWEFHTDPDRGDDMTYRTLELKGDTVINGKTYKAMHKYSGDAINWENDTIPVYLREENKVVYGIIPDGKLYDDCPVYNYYTDYLMTYGSPSTYNGQEFALYDFNDPVAYFDSIFSLAGGSSQYQHLSTDTIAVGNHLAKRFHGVLLDWLDYQIIEGIGQVALNTSPLYFDGSISPGFHCQSIYSLVKVVEDGEVIYPQNYEEVDRYMPLIREGIKWVYEKVVVNNGDTTCSYYTYEFKGNHPEKGTDNHTRKALYRYNGYNHKLNVETDSLVAGLRENSSFVMHHHNEPLNYVMDQGRDMIDLLAYDYYLPYEYDPILYGFRFVVSNWIYINQQREPFLNEENYVDIEPIMIDGYPCSRAAYIGEQGDTLAYVVEGIGFDSYDMGDLLTPFTRKPDPTADYQEWCGLSHVIKDGKIIYKGMRYRPVVPGDVDGDGEVTLSDVSSVTDIVVMGGNTGHNHTPAADVNGDGEITIADVNAIINMILSKK